MGTYKRYNKKDKHGNPVIGKDGRPIKEGPWFIQYPHRIDPVTGKTIYRTQKASHSKKKAQEMFRAKQDAFNAAQVLGIQVRRDMTVSEVIDWGLDQDVMKAKKSAPDDNARAQYLRDHIGGCRAKELTPLMVENFRVRMTGVVSEKTKRRLSRSTINKIVGLGRRVFNLAESEGLVLGNPFKNSVMFKEPPKGEYIPDHEFRAILMRLPGYLQRVAIVAYHTGMRKGEILGLTWDRVDLEQGLINLTSEDTKTGEQRVIFFRRVAELVETISLARAERKPDQDLVFTVEGMKPVHPTYSSKLFKTACVAAEVGPYRFHDLRHTFNTNMVKAGVSRTTIMKLTGHKTLSMFLRYSHLDREQAEDAMTKLGTLLANTQEVAKNPASTS